MKKFIIALFALTLTKLVFAREGVEYKCQSKYVKSLSLTLVTDGEKLELASGYTKCATELDDSYRPTGKYEGYSRFVMKRDDGVIVKFKACQEFSNKVLNSKGNSFDSIKVSGSVFDSEEKAQVTIVFDVGDYHGQLANEKVVCELL